jgi:hypothetical protein
VTGRGKGRGTVPAGDDRAAVVITLKDVYESSQALTARVADSFTELRLTLQDISHHLHDVDSRNQAADEIHKDHGTRLRALEDAQVSSAAVGAATDKAELARQQSRWALVAAVISAAGVMASLLGLLPHV